MRRTAEGALALGKFYLSRTVRGIETPTAPHLDPETLPDFLDRLSNSASYLEFGGGGSTLAAAEAGVSTITVENDRRYARVLRQALGEGSSVTLVYADTGPTREWGIPLRGRPTPKRVAKWETYLRLAFEAVYKAGDFPDLILVDGRFRRACALMSAAELSKKLGPRDCTLVIDDYTDRPHYHDVERSLGTPRIIGRAAWFELQARTVNVDEDDLAEAMGDFR